MGFFESETYNLCDDLLVVVLVVVVAAVDVGFVDLFTQGAIVGILQEGQPAGIVERKEPLPLLSVGFGFGSSTGSCTLTSLFLNDLTMEISA